MLVTDGRYAERAAADLAAAGVDAEVVVAHDPAEGPRAASSTCAGDGPVRAEADHLTHAAWTDLAGDLDLRPDDGHDRRRCGGSRTTASWPG